MNNILPTGIVGDIYRTLNVKINDKTGSDNLVKSLQSVVFERLSGQIALLVTFIISLVIFFITNGKYEASAYVLMIIISFVILTRLVFYFPKKK